jgi:RNA polymerase sigma-70 factor (ECF subfamily)
VSEEPPLDFSRVYETYWGKVRSYAARLIGLDDADDIANEVFVKIARSLGTLSDRSRLTSWIYAITINTVRDAARTRASRFAHLGERELPGVRDDKNDGLQFDLPDSTARTPEETAVRNEMVACYLDYVNQLPASYREVYILSEFEALSNAEIAGRLTLSLATVKIRLHRARAALHEELRRRCQCYRNERGELMAEPKREY